VADVEAPGGEKGNI